MKNWIGFNKILNDCGVSPNVTKLYRHKPGEAEQRWMEGIDRFVSFATYQNKSVFSSKVKYCAHFLPGKTD